MINNYTLSKSQLISKEYCDYQRGIKSWPYLITSYDQVPDFYKDVFPTFKENSFPYTILIPDENYSFFKKKGYLIVVLEDKVCILDKFGSKINSNYFNKHEIIYVVSGTVLLRSWITILGNDKKYTFSFHSSKESLFNPVIEKFRDRGQIQQNFNENEKNCLLFESEDEKLKSNLKFRNLIRNQFIHGDKIEKIIFQPSFLFKYGKIPLLNKNLFKRYVSSHIMLFTTKELILIQERKKHQRKIYNNYSSSFTFINYINILSYEESIDENKSFRELIITLKNGTQLHTFFSVKNNDFSSFVSQLKQYSEKIKSLY